LSCSWPSCCSSSSRCWPTSSACPSSGEAQPRPVVWVVYLDPPHLFPSSAN
jgi:hypothetical protein